MQCISSGFVLVFYTSKGARQSHRFVPQWIIPKGLKVVGSVDNKTFVVLGQAYYFKSS